MSEDLATKDLVSSAASTFLCQTWNFLPILVCFGSVGVALVLSWSVANRGSRQYTRGAWEGKEVPNAVCEGVFDLLKIR